MKNKGNGLLVLIGIFMLSFPISVIHKSDYNNINTRLLKTNDYYDESPGIPILGTTENIFSICQWNGDMEHHNLYFYNISLGGSLYKVDLDNPQFVPILVRGYLGDVYDIDTSYAPDGDMVFFATSEYNNAIMKMNVTTLVYEKILSSPLLPLKLSVDFDYRFKNIFIIWRTKYNVYAWNSVFEIIKNIETDFYSYFDERTVQCEGYDVLCYNSEEIILYDTYSTYPPTKLKRIVDTGITSVFWDTSRDYIIYAQDDDYTNYADGKIIQYDYFTDEMKCIQSNIDYPVSIWCTSNYIYWLEQGYWSTRSMIYRYSYYGYDTHYYSKVSRAHGVMWADRIEFQNEYSYSLNRLGVYWGYEQLYIVNGSDITPPDTIEWMNTQKIKEYDYWSISWWNSYDLNGIEDYELIVSETDDFSNYDTYWVSEGEYSSTSLEFSDMEYGDYYYKVRTRDTMGLDPMEESNIGKWSNILKISYPNPETSDLSNRITDILPIIITLSIIGVTTGLGIVGYIIYKRRKRKDII